MSPSSASFAKSVIGLHTKRKQCILGQPAGIARYAYVGRHVLAGEQGVHLFGGPVIECHAPEGAGEEVHGKEHDDEQPPDLRCGDEAELSVRNRLVCVYNVRL